MLINNLLFGTVVILTIVSIFIAYIPDRHNAMVDPTEMLRYE